MAFNLIDYYYVVNVVSPGSFSVCRVGINKVLWKFNFVNYDTFDDVVLGFAAV
jgi:hypothetical protein